VIEGVVVKNGGIVGRDEYELSRRTLLKIALAASALPLLSSCGGAPRCTTAGR
jgi:hypothetical protein